MGKVVILNKTESSEGLTVRDLVRDLTVELESGGIHPETRCVALLLNWECPDEDDFSIRQLNYGLRRSKVITMLECAKMQGLQEMGYIPEEE